jgi:hypothetical protein
VGILSYLHRNAGSALLVATTGGFLEDRSVQNAAREALVGAEAAVS